MKHFIAIILFGASLTACAHPLSPGQRLISAENCTPVIEADAISFHTLKEQGWIEIKPGLFQPDPFNDPTLLGVAVFPGTSMEEAVLEWQFPEALQPLITETFIWKRSRADLDIPNQGSLTAEVALSASDSAVYLLFFATLSGKFDSLRSKVMEPILRNFDPTEFQSEHIDQIIKPDREIQPVETKIREADGMTMVYVPAGEFEMGNPGTQWVWNGDLEAGNLGLQIYTDESPQHSVYLDAYWVDQTEVTVGMFRIFVEATGYKTRAEIDGWGAPYKPGPVEDEWTHIEGVDWLHPQDPNLLARDDHPVVQVSWEDAAAYCAWVGGALPTEAQWEKAARGTDSRLWPWGGTYIELHGNFCDSFCPVERYKQLMFTDGHSRTAPTGSFPYGASPYGALDMAGNVWEWVADWYDESYYANSPYENPGGPLYGTERTQRGGAWLDNESWVRTTVRHATPPWVRCDDLGFRCAYPANSLDYDWPGHRLR